MTKKWILVQRLCCNYVKNQIRIYDKNSLEIMEIKSLSQSLCVKPINPKLKYKTSGEPLTTEKSWQKRKLNC